METFICFTCGTQYPPAEEKPLHCPICRDERQYLPVGGQQWTTLGNLQRNHRLTIRKPEEHLYGIGSTPEFGIGQRALLVQTGEGNLLWDCIGLIDETAVDLINALGGLDAIAISHPHYYTTMVEWSRAFGGIPVWLHEADRQWVQYPDENLRFWNGRSRELFGGMTLWNTGGHFEGAAILHWPSGAGGKGALLTGDIVQVVPDRKHVSFMYSYPNQIPLNAETVRRIAEVMEPLPFDRIYGAWWDRNIPESGKESVARSVDRYIRAIG